MQLETLGWDAHFQTLLNGLQDPSLVPARVLRQERRACVVVGPMGEATPHLSGRLKSRGEPPVAGDWVALRPDGVGGHVIEAVLPRRTRFSRKRAGEETREQVVAANVDGILLAMGPPPDFSLARLDRYLALAVEGGAQPVVLLTKADAWPDLQEALAQVRARVSDAPVLAVSAVHGDGLDALRALLAPRRTYALLGSSGVGKSTLLNALLGEDRLATGAVRASDGKGRHTTTRRELVPLPRRAFPSETLDQDGPAGGVAGGALLLDTPGMRELGLWSDGSGVEAVFADVEELAARCRFRDCRHEGEPACAVRAALEEGTLTGERLASHRKLQREAAFHARRASESGKRDERRDARAFGRMARDVVRMKRDRLRDG